MKSEQVVALVKELVGNQLVQATWLSIDRGATGDYELHLKGRYEPSMLDAFLLNHNLSEKINEEKDFLIIFKS